MAVIGVKSITGITSITNAAGGADVLTFHSNNTTERARITSSGRFGLGTTSPDHIFEVESNNSSIAVSRDGSNAQLLFKSNSVGQAGTIQVNESSGGGTMRFFTKTTAGANTEKLRITSAGLVGIGELSPSSDVTFTVRKDVAAASGNATMQIRNLYQGTANQSNASGAEVEFVFKNHNASHNWWGGRILCYNSDNYNQYTNLQFHTASQGNAVERMRLNHDGDLTLYGKDNAELKLKAGTTTGNGVIAFLNSSGTTKGNIFYDTDDNFMVFKTNGTASSNERLRITSDGKVGINDSNPSNDLVVKAPGGSGHSAAKVTSGDASTTMVMQAIQGSEGRLGMNSNHPLAIYAGGLEKVRIDSSGNVSIGHANAWHNYASGATGTNTRLAAVHSTGTGWKEMAHFAAGTDDDNTGSVVRLSHYGNDRGAYLKAGRGDSDRAIAYFGLRNSGNTDTDLLTFRQDSGEYRTITNSEFRFNLPTNAERSIVAFSDHSTSYNLGSSGGAAIRFKNTSGSHTIEFDTHWTGNHHATALKIGKTGSLIMRDHRDASIGREYTSGTLTNGQSVSYNGSGTTLTNGKLNLNSVGGNAGGWIGCLSVASTDGNPSGAAMIMGVHGQGFNVYNRLLSNFDSGITVTWATNNWNYQISNSSGETIHYVFNVIHMGTANTTYYGR